MHCVIARVYPLYYAPSLSSFLRPYSRTIFSGRDFLPGGSSLLPSLFLSLFSLSFSLSLLLLSHIHTHLLYTHALYQTGYLRECDPRLHIYVGEQSRRWEKKKIGWERERWMRGRGDAAIYATTTIRAIIFACTHVARTWFCRRERRDWIARRANVLTRTSLTP